MSNGPEPQGGSAVCQLNDGLRAEDRVDGGPADEGGPGDRGGDHDGLAECRSRRRHLCHAGVAATNGQETDEDPGERVAEHDRQQAVPPAQPDELSGRDRADPDGHEAEARGKADGEEAPR